MSTTRWIGRDELYGDTVYQELPHQPGYATCVLAGGQPPADADTFLSADLDQLTWLTRETA